MLLASPHAGLSPALRDVTCGQLPTAPAHTSGGWANDSRTIAEVFPSAASEAEVSRPAAAILSLVWNAVSILPSLTLTAARPLPPSISSLKKIFVFSRQVSQHAEAFIPGVALRAVPPSAGIIKMSPPILPSSLMSPPMNATDFASGDHAGLAICVSIGGW